MHQLAYALLVVSCLRYVTLAPLPVVLWHGLGDTCCSTQSMGAIKNIIQEELGDVFVYSVATGNTFSKDLWSSYFGNVNEQVAFVCSQLNNVTELAGGYNAIGFSQGGQFLRAVVERCQHTGPPVRTLISMGGQHQGVATVPNCAAMDPSMYCRTLQLITNQGLYLPWIRNNVVPAQYFKNSALLAEYLLYNEFLADINNERPQKSALYRDNLVTLQRLVLFMFEEDTVVEPKESSHFGFFNGTVLLNMTDTELYQQDWIGLRQLHKEGRLDLDIVPGAGHMHLTEAWFAKNVVRKYLAGDTGDRKYLAGDRETT